VSIINIEVVPGRPRTTPVLTYHGWRTFLRQKILSNPDEMFQCMSGVALKLGVQIPLARTDFPATPDPGAVALEAQFRNQIYAMMRAAGVSGAAVGGVAGGHAQGHGNSKDQMAAAAGTGLIKFMFGQLNGGGFS
jgi:hypothetical protein